MRAAWMLVLAGPMFGQPTEPPAWHRTLANLPHNVPLGANDRLVADAWAAAKIAAPAAGEYFPSAANLAANYFHGQGYELRALEILREAIGLTRSPAPEATRSLRLQMTQLLRASGRIVQAADLASAMVAENPEDADAIATLTQLKESIGELVPHVERHLHPNFEIVRGGVSQGDALVSLARLQISEREFESPERTIDEVRRSAPGSTRTADQLLAQLRYRQGRVEEGAALIHSTMRPVNRSDAARRIDETRKEIRRKSPEEVATQLDRLIGSIEDDVRKDPRQAIALQSLLDELPDGQRHRFTTRMVAILNGVIPDDHPKLAHVLLLLAEGLPHGSRERTDILDRAEKILIAAKGADSPSLSQVDCPRVEMLQSRGDFAEAVKAAERMSGRADSISGPKSIAARNAFRQLAGVYQFAGDWALEERTRLALIERSAGSTWVALRAMDMRALAARYQEQELDAQAIQMYRGAEALAMQAQAAQQGRKP